MRTLIRTPSQLSVRLSGTVISRHFCADISTQNQALNKFPCTFYSHEFSSVQFPYRYSLVQFFFISSCITIICICYTIWFVQSALQMIIINAFNLTSQFTWKSEFKFIGGIANDFHFIDSLHSLNSKC